MVVPAQLGLLLRCQRCREGGAATQEKLSLQIQEKKLFSEPERKDLEILSSPDKSFAAAGSFFTLSVQGAT